MVGAFDGGGLTPTAIFSVWLILVPGRFGPEFYAPKPDGFIAVRYPALGLANFGSSFHILFCICDHTVAPSFIVSST